MIEIRSSCMQGKPILALMEPDVHRGGLSKDAVRKQLLDADANYGKWGFGSDGPNGAMLCEALFAQEEIEWNRIGCFQDVTLRLIAERLLLEAAGAPDTKSSVESSAAPSVEDAKRPRWSYSSSVHSSVKLPRSVKSSVKSSKHRVVHSSKVDVVGSTYVQGELVNQNPKLSPPSGRFHVYCSSNNPGAIALMEEVRTTFDLDLLVTTDRHQMGQCDQFLVYLTSLTWTCRDTEAFAQEVRDAMKAGVPLLLAHEMSGTNQEERHGCEFGSFFACEAGATPSDLLRRGIYSMIAVALKGAQWRETSMVLLAQSLTLAKSSSTSTLISKLSSSSSEALEAARMASTKTKIAALTLRAKSKLTACACTSSQLTSTPTTPTVVVDDDDTGATLSWLARHLVPKGMRMLTINRADVAESAPTSTHAAPVDSHNHVTTLEMAATSVTTTDGGEVGV